jgi:hypothetical protein
MIRVNHYGMDAELGVVRDCLTALGEALGGSVDVAGAVQAAGVAWAGVVGVG